MEYALFSVSISLIVVVFLLLWFLGRQHVLYKRLTRLEDVMRQAVGPNLAQRLVEKGTGFRIPDREWAEDDESTE